MEETFRPVPWCVSSTASTRLGAPGGADYCLGPTVLTLGEAHGTPPPAQVCRRDASLHKRDVHPNRVAIWPVEVGGYGIDFTYHGAIGYIDARRQSRSFRRTA